jgi:hypothetical protein
LQSAEHLWPLTNVALVNQHFAIIDELEDVQFARCAALQHQPELIRSTTLFLWWPKRVHKRRGPKRIGRSCGVPSGESGYSGKESRRKSAREPGDGKERDRWQQKQQHKTPCAVTCGG